jgi:SAM-dependent methyltransferase
MDMGSSNTLTKPSLLLGDLYRNARRACMLKAWELSGGVVAHYYDNLLQQFGASAQALDERSETKEHLFYDHLFNAANLPPALSVLDIGCGMGNLIEYLLGHEYRIDDYLGIDLVQQFVDVCRAKYGHPFTFRQANFIRGSFVPDRTYDLVVNMGVMVSRVLSYEQYVEYCVRKMIGLSRKYVLFNVIIGVDSSMGNYQGLRRIGHITCIPKSKLFAILDAAANDLGVRYALHEVQIYPDATDAFVCITANSG